MRGGAASRQVAAVDRRLRSHFPGLKVSRAVPTEAEDARIFQAETSRVIGGAAWWAWQLVRGVVAQGNDAGKRQVRCSMLLGRQDGLAVSLTVRDACDGRTRTYLAKSGQGVGRWRSDRRPSFRPSFAPFAHPLRPVLRPSAFR